MNQLMEICNRFMLRRTSAVLKKLLPAKVEQVGCSCDAVLKSASHASKLCVACPRKPDPAAA
jgi:hypothetical protein